MTFSYDELHILVVEIEAIPNSQPLMHVESDLDSGFVECSAFSLILSTKGGGGACQI